MLAYHERRTLSDGKAAESRPAGCARANSRLWTDLRREVIRVAARTGRAASRPGRFHDLSGEERTFVLCATTGRSIGAVALHDSGDGVQCRYWRNGAPEPHGDLNVAYESNEGARLIVDDARERRAFESTAALATHLVAVLLQRPPAPESRKRRG